MPPFVLDAPFGPNRILAVQLDASVLGFLERPFTKFVGLLTLHPTFIPSERDTGD